MQKGKRRRSIGRRRCWTPPSLDATDCQKSEWRCFQTRPSLTDDVDLWMGIMWEDMSHENDEEGSVWAARVARQFLFENSPCV
jgi:hypothetical protein